MTTWTDLEGQMAVLILNMIPAFPKELVTRTYRCMQVTQATPGLTTAQKKQAVVAAVVSFASAATRPQSPPPVDSRMLGYAFDAVFNATDAAMVSMRLADAQGVEPAPSLAEEPAVAPVKAPPPPPAHKSIFGHKK